MGSRVLGSPNRSLVVALLAIAGLTACADDSQPDRGRGGTSASGLANATASDVRLQDVVDTFVLGSDRTDLQRDQMKAQLVGAVVRWEVVVYNIEADGEGYRVTSDQRSPASAVPFLVAVYVTPRGEADVQRLLQTRTGDRLEFVGKISDIRLRSMVVLSPAVLSP
jgi:hypothetical protein